MTDSRTLRTQRLSKLHERCMADANRELYAIAATSDDERTLRALCPDWCLYPDYGQCPDELRESHNEVYRRTWFDLISPNTQFYDWKLDFVSSYFFELEDRVWVVQLGTNGFLPPYYTNEFNDLATQLAIDVLVHELKFHDKNYPRDWLQYLFSNRPTRRETSVLNDGTIDVIRLIGNVHYASAHAIECVLDQPLIQAMSLQSQSPPKPRWDRDCRELSFDGEQIIQLTGRATNLIKVLDCFEDDEWKTRIDSPFTSDESGATKLREAASDLSKKQTRISFNCDGTGEGIRWQPVDKAATPMELRRDG